MLTDSGGASTVQLWAHECAWLILSFGTVDVRSTPIANQYLRIFLVYLLPKLVTNSLSPRLLHTFLVFLYQSWMAVAALCGRKLFYIKISRTAIVPESKPIDELNWQQQQWAGWKWERKKTEYGKLLCLPPQSSFSIISNPIKSVNRIIKISSVNACKENLSPYRLYS